MNDPIYLGLKDHDMLYFFPVSSQRVDEEPLLRFQRLETASSSPSCYGHSVSMARVPWWTTTCIQSVSHSVTYKLLVMSFRIAFTLPNCPGLRWIHHLPISTNLTTAHSTPSTPSRLPPCHPSPLRRTSTHPGCVHTRATDRHYLSQSIALCALPSSHARLTSTVTFELVCFFSEPVHDRNLTYE